MAVPHAHAAKVAAGLGMFVVIACALRAAWEAMFRWHDDDCACGEADCPLKTEDQ